MHRLHGDDLAGHVLAQEDWDVVRLPAIAEADELHRVETMFGRQCFGRKAGEALQPEREPRRCWHSFAAPWANTILPANTSGAFAARRRHDQGRWLRSYAANEWPAEFDRIVQSWDTANKASELSDFSVCTSWGIKGKDLYLLHVLRRRMECASRPRPLPRVWC